MRAADLDPIDRYVRALDARLRGPTRLKADLLAEAGAGLRDAAEAYREEGLDPDAACRRAVAEFGAPTDVAPAYQRELAAGQGRRAAMLVTLLPLSMLTADSLWWRAPADTGRPPSEFLLLTEALDWTSYAVGALALVALVLLARPHGPDPRRVARVVGAATIVACAFVWVVGTYAATTAIAEAPESLTWPPMLLALALLNGGMAMFIRTGVRCLSAGRHRVGEPVRA